MFGNSRVPDLANGADKAVLASLVDRHLRHDWRPPVPDHDRQAFETARQWRRQAGSGRPLILDSGCGTALSSVTLASRRPEALVIGLDKSAARLARAGRRFTLPENLLLLRTDCAVFWLLARGAGWRLADHYLLYPNPWPKPGHLKRRWYGHPAFPLLMALGGRLEVRSNWRPYLDDFARALQWAGKSAPTLEELDEGETAMTDFEHKYRGSGQSLYRLHLPLG